MANQKFKTKVQADAGVQLTAETASMVVVLDASKNLKSSSISETSLGYLDATSSVQTQLDAKAPIASPTFTGTVSGISATMVGLGNVDNTSDANKPVSSAQATAIGLKISSTEKGAANGVATLDSNSLIPIAQIPPAALERLVIVADQTAQYALTTATVQNGDTVKLTSTGEMFIVVDSANLANSAGYVVYSAGTAVNFSGSLSGDVTGTQSSTAISAATVTGKALTGFVSSAGIVSATDTILSAIDKLDGNINAIGAGVVGDLALATFMAANNQVAPASVTGFAFSTSVVRSFKAQVSVAIDATAGLYEEFDLSGIQLSTGFVMSIASVGDDSGIVFSITSAGQIKYTSTNVAGFVSDKISFRAMVTHV